MGVRVELLSHLRVNGYGCSHGYIMRTDTFAVKMTDGLLSLLLGKFEERRYPESIFTAVRRFIMAFSINSDGTTPKS
jgi:hypothetical protein